MIGKIAIATEHVVDLPIFEGGQGIQSEAPVTLFDLPDEFVKLRGQHKMFPVVLYQTGIVATLHQRLFVLKMLACHPHELQQQSMSAPAKVRTAETSFESGENSIQMGSHGKVLIVQAVYSEQPIITPAQKWLHNESPFHDGTRRFRKYTTSPP